MGVAKFAEVKESELAAPTVTFTEYARAMEHGESIPQSLVELFGSDPTPYQVLQRLVPRTERRERGTFFTSSATAKSLWREAIDSIQPKSVVVDPACGAGDLLWPVAEKIANSDMANVTLRACDVDQDFTRIAAARLRRVVGARHKSVEGLTRDFLVDDASVTDATHVVLNPPFVPIVVEEPWASGRTNAAALFTIRALEAMRIGGRLLAVLPDVLRSGSRYAAWRETVEGLASLNRIEVYDVFDEQTDVHVFILDATVGSGPGAAAWNPSPSDSTLKDYADIRVGAVVPHRDPEDGPICRYVTARSLSSGEELVRGFSGRKENGPFILVNRTSRPGESPRVRARPWTDPGDVAVENHLLIVAPKDGVRVSDVLKVLGSDATADFLDNRIRCRHLTVRALKEIPWPI